MRWLLCVMALSWSADAADMHTVQRLVEAARNHSPDLGSLLAQGLPLLHGRDGAVVWGQDFLFAVESDAPATVSVDGQPAVAHVTGIRLQVLVQADDLATWHHAQL